MLNNRCRATGTPLLAPTGGFFRPEHQPPPSSVKSQHAVNANNRCRATGAPVLAPTRGFVLQHSYLLFLLLPFVIKIPEVDHLPLTIRPSRHELRRAHLFDPGKYDK